MKRVTLLINKVLVVIFAFVGVAISMINARLDGYSSGATRLLYFTTLSNLWIGITDLILIVAISLKNEKNLNKLYFLRYIFTVSITVTGVFFCFILGPNADESYHPWSIASIMTHALSPAFAIIDFFVDRRKIKLSIKGVALSVLPSALYTLVASVLGTLGVDFGRGEAFPYFFMNYHSPAGLFGFSNEMPYLLGSFYWIAFLIALMIGLASFYALFSYGKEKPRQQSNGAERSTI